MKNASYKAIEKWAIVSKPRRKCIRDTGCPEKMRYRRRDRGREENRRNRDERKRLTGRPARAGRALLSLSSRGTADVLLSGNRALFLASISRGRPVAPSPSARSATDLANRWRRRRRDCGLTAKLCWNVISCPRDSLPSPFAPHSRLSNEYTISRFRSSAPSRSLHNDKIKKRVFIGSWKFHLRIVRLIWSERIVILNFN